MFGTGSGDDEIDSGDGHDINVGDSQFGSGAGDYKIDSGDGDDFNFGDTSAFDSRLPPTTGSGDDLIKSGEGDDTNYGDTSVGTGSGDDKIDSGDGDDTNVGDSWQSRYCRRSRSAARGRVPAAETVDGAARRGPRRA